MAKECLPGMVANNHGHIINVASMSAFIPPAGLADYSASKAGLIALHEVQTNPLEASITPELKIRLGTWVRTSISSQSASC